MSEVIFFTSHIYINCWEYIISELLFCLERIEFEHISYSQDTSTEAKKNDSLKIILTKPLSVDRLYGMQMSVFQFKILHRHYHNNCDHNFWKVSDIHKHSSTTIEDNTNRQLNSLKHFYQKRATYLIILIAINVFKTVDCMVCRRVFLNIRWSTDIIFTIIVIIIPVKYMMIKNASPQPF